ncbi:hypothetical protein ACIBU0_05495 [Streptomyces sp. NPDC049627]|uniref:hypothetical protein n=1 Tax=Streptomyces sp. NPDC049627 TaxID=3365595 RepID=UPI00379D0478
MNDFQDRDSVHQIVFRWDGNHGRQGTGMNAVAHSCDAARAEELGRELGPLLWVSGAAAARPSVVRTLSRDDDVLLVQRWPTTDPGGRPSTVSHVLVGNRTTLQPARCLGLSYGGWRKQERAEQESGQLARFDLADLHDLARGRLPGMVERLPEVERALILAGAELLRDPGQRVSLLLEEKTPESWPDPAMVPLVYLGLFLIFGSWLGEEWTFATYDTVDSHPLRLMSVPRWEPDSGGSGPLARVMGRRPATFQFEHRAAAQLVAHLLAHPQAPPGVPQLVEALPDGAALDWEHRRDRLRKILGPDRQERSRPREREREPEPEGERESVPELDRAGAPLQGTPAPEAYPTAPYEAPHEASYEARYGQPYHDTHALHLHQDLRDHSHGDAMRRSLVMARLSDQPDEVLLNELSSGELPPDSLDLVLRELGRPERVHARHPEMRHALCAEVLRNGLYFRPQGMAMADRAAELFAWAVAPVARDRRHLTQLGEVLHLMSRSTHPTAFNWLRQSIIEPPNGQVPDLPPELWRELLRDAMNRNGRHPTTPSPPRPAQAPAAPPPQPPDLDPDPIGFTARLSDMINNPSCFIAGIVVLGVVLVGLVLMLFI